MFKNELCLKCSYLSWRHIFRSWWNGVKHVVLCSIWHHLCNFKKREKHPWRSTTFSNTPPRVIRHFIDYTNGTESRKAAHIKIWRTQNLNITFLWNENRSWDLTIQKSCFCLLQWKPLVMWVNGLTKYVKLRRVALAFTLHKAFLENSLEVASPPHFVHFSRKLFLVIFYYQTKFHCLIAFTCCIEQYVYCNCVTSQILKLTFAFLSSRFPAHDQRVRARMLIY